jgi:haloacetate dehalogenase
MFEGFALERVDVGGAELRVRHGGSGPAVLLLHGHPRTHVTWHMVAPVLARQFTVVCPDLRGYGESSKPPTTADHRPYSKRVMAADCLALMRALGHERFCVAGHDRGLYVAQRLAMDHPASVRRLCVLDGIPLGEALSRCDARFAASWYHWFFFGQTQRPAERYINADPDAWYTASDKYMGAEAFEDYRRAIHDPATVHAMMEDYRAGLGIDRSHDEADRAAGRRIGCPVLFLWAARDDMEDLYGDPLAIWREWGDDVRGQALDCGHHIAEEAPAELAALLTGFFAPADLTVPGSLPRLIRPASLPRASPAQPRPRQCSIGVSLGGRPGGPEPARWPAVTVPTGAMGHRTGWRRAVPGHCCPTCLPVITLAYPGQAGVAG